MEIQNRRFDKFKSLISTYQVGQIFFITWILAASVISLVYMFTDRWQHLPERSNSTTNVYELGNRVDFAYLCTGFLYESDIGTPRVSIPDTVRKFLKATNYTISSSRENINRTVPHFITLCASPKTCITYSSREFCEILLALGEYGGD